MFNIEYLVPKSINLQFDSLRPIVTVHVSENSDCLAVWSLADESTWANPLFFLFTMLL